MWVWLRFHYIGQVSWIQNVVNTTFRDNIKGYKKPFIPPKVTAICNILKLTPIYCKSQCCIDTSLYSSVDNRVWHWMDLHRLAFCSCNNTFNAYHTVNWSLGKLPCLGPMTIQSCSIPLLDWIRSDHDMPWELGNICSLSSALWGAAGAALTARFRALGNCVLRLQTSFQNVRGS